MLIHDDAYIPGVLQNFSPLTRDSRLRASQGDPEPLRDGINRPIGHHSHAWSCRKGDWIEYQFSGLQQVHEATVVLDSALDKLLTMSRFQADDQLTTIPDVMPRAFRLEGLSNGQWILLNRWTDNYQRLVRFTLDRPLQGVRFVLEDTWGRDTSQIYAFYLC